MIDGKSIAICIPARYASQRLPGKPLLDIGGTPMIIRVAQRCQLVMNIDQVVVLTDDNRILSVCQDHKIACIMTSSDHQNGTERLLEYCEAYHHDYYVNVQGDEPLFDTTALSELVSQVVTQRHEIGTLIAPVTTPSELFDYNKVKLVTDSRSRALYFSRQAIPAQRDEPYKSWFDKAKYFQHIGIYIFSKKALNDISTLSVCEIEQHEKLEQLRWLYHGMHIYCHECKETSISIDTEADYQKVVAFLSKKNK